MRVQTCVGVGLALLLSACGTTVPGASGQLGATGAGSDGLSLPTVSTTSTGQVVTGGGGSGEVGSAPTTPGQVVVPGAPRVPTGTTPGAQPTAAPTAPGAPGTGGVALTTPVRVGVLYIDGADAVAGGLGISGLSTGDASEQARAVVQHLNAKGGLAGRRIDLRMGKMAAGDMSNDPQRAHAAACASLTQDQKVSYVISYVQLTAGQVACYAKHGVTVLDDQSSLPDDQGASYAATFGSPGELALGRASTELVDALWRTGWLDAKSKVGTFVYDSAEGRALETRYLVPALARHGLTPAVKARTSAAADGANQSGTVLQLRAKNVDRVIPIGASPLFLMVAADSQGYRPRYAMTSTFGPGALMESAAPRAQLTGAAGIGWSKYLDIGSGTKPGAVSANETLCFSLMAGSGQQTTSATTKAFQAAICNVLMFLKAAADRYGVVPDLLARVRSGGLAFPPADAFGIAMRPGRADGASAYRDLVFAEACSCFQYVGGNRSTG